MTVLTPDATSKLLSVSGRSVTALFADWADRIPDKPFLVWAPFEGRAQTLSYAEFWALSGRVATGLAARGVTAGSRILLHMDNSPEFLLTWLASARLGAVAVTTNTRCVADEIDYFVAKSDAVGVVTQAAFAPLFTEIAKNHALFVVTDAGGDGRAFADAIAVNGMEPRSFPARWTSSPFNSLRARRPGRKASSGPMPMPSGARGQRRATSASAMTTSASWCCRCSIPTPRSILCCRHCGSEGRWCCSRAFPLPTSGRRQSPTVRPGRR